jgi:hypothetical protein
MIRPSRVARSWQSYNLCLSSGRRTGEKSLELTLGCSLKTNTRRMLLSNKSLEASNSIQMHGCCLSL